MIRFRRAARNVQWGGVSGIWGHIPYLPKTEGRRITPPVVVRGGAPSAQKFCIFLAKITEFYVYIFTKINPFKTAQKLAVLKHD